MKKYLDVAMDLFDKKEYDKALEQLNKALDNKEYEALSILAMIYIKGLGVETNIDKALEYLFLGDKYEDKKCISILGDYYYNGKYVNKDLDKAKSYYNRASLMLEPHATGMLGLFLYNEEKYSEAIEYFKSAALYSDTNSMYYLAKCAYDGIGMDKDYELSFALFNKLYEINKDNNEIKKYLADMYFNGYGTPQDFSKAKELYETLDDNDSIFNLALIYKNHLKEYEKAYELFKRVKNGKSQFEQALMLYNGLGINENKNDAYFKFYACAMSKYVYSYPFVGDCYYYGYGVKKDYSEAIKWYELALSENLKNQNLNIGLSYLKLKKYDEAISYLEKEEDSVNKFKALGEIYLKLKKYDLSYNAYLCASEYDDSYSMLQVSKMLKKGKGVEKNKELSSIYYLKYLKIIALEDNENT